jgi:BNR repeat-like domain
MSVHSFGPSGEPWMETLMMRNRAARNFYLFCSGMVITWLVDVASAAEPPKVERHVVIYRETDRFAGWPANHGIWSWGDEVLVGFSRGYDKDRGPYHHIDKQKPEDYLLARSRDGGTTWAVEVPQPPGALIGTPGMRHGLMPPASSPEQPVPLRERMRFDNPDFALTVRMEETNTGQSRFYYSNNRGKTWRGPFELPLFGQKGVMARTDYIVDGPDRCTLFLTASKVNKREGRPFCVRTTDGGLSWQFLSFIGPEPIGYSIMPSTVRLSTTDLVTTIRRQDPPKSWIDAYGSRDDGRSWSLLSTPEPDTGEGNPPSLLRLADGRLCLIYGLRRQPLGIYARTSNDGGTTWSDAITLRNDGASRDLGYVRSVVRSDGKVIAVYYFHDHSQRERYLAATIWDPGKP